MKKLISTTNFVLVQFDLLCKGEISQEEYISRTKKYAEFLKKPLELDMFILCVDGEPFSHKKHNLIHFEEAKKKGTILFKGFSFIELKDNFYSGYVKDSQIDLVYPFPNNRNYTIENLVQNNALLTDSFINNIGIKD